MRAWWAGLVVATAAIAALFSVLFGPFVFVPAVAATYAVLFAPQTTEHERNLLHTVLTVAVSVPAILGELDLVPCAPTERWSCARRSSRSRRPAR